MANETRVISNSNFVAFLTELKRILDRDYMSSHRRTKNFRINGRDHSWILEETDKETKGLYYVNITHGFNNPYVSALAYSMDTNTPVDSVRTAIRIVNNNTIRIYSKGNDPVIIIVYEIASSVSVKLRIESNYDNVDDQSLWTSATIKDYIEYYSKNVLLGNMVSDIIADSTFNQTIDDVINDKIENMSIDEAVNAGIENKMSEIKKQIDVQIQTISNRTDKLKSDINDIDSRVSQLSEIQTQLDNIITTRLNKVNDTIVTLDGRIERLEAQIDDILANGMGTCMDDEEINVLVDRWGETTTT